MSRPTRRAVAASGLLCVIGLLYLSGLEASGLLGPDEPRYASIAREMARSGDWLTPRLWGEPWFEKPPLTYWLMAAAFRLGLSEDLAPRLPIALASLIFLAWYWRTLTREFGRRVGFLAALMLSTSTGWLAFSRVGVTDLPLAATYSAAMLLALPWVARGETRGLTPAAALLGLAVLAKGLVAPVLYLPLLWVGRRRLRDWIRPGPLLAFLLTALPWYLFVSLKYGRLFLDEFFLEHHLHRVYTDRLQHVQPWWFYLPVLAAGLFPWTPAALLTARRSLYEDTRARLLLASTLWGIFFFSLARNKLPGYLLPLLPGIFALVALGLEQARRPRMALASSAALLSLIPPAVAVLPSALVVGIRKAAWPGVPWAAAVAVIPLVLWCWRQASRRREWAAVGIAAAMALAVTWTVWRVLPVLDRRVSVRAFWRSTTGAALRCCVDENVDRERRYGLNYYAGRALPACDPASPACRIHVGPGGLLELTGR